MTATELKNSHEFIINQFITLKLEYGSTTIYIKGKRFHQCKYLLLNVPLRESEKVDAIDSIDEASVLLNRSLEMGGSRIPPEVEFWGHCSNIQAWVEHGYDTRILHSNLAFPLLKRLTEEGDLKAKKVFQEEIAKRIESGYLPVIEYLTFEGYLNYLSKAQLSSLNLSFTNEFIKNAQEWVTADREFVFHESILQLFTIEQIQKVYDTIFSVYKDHARYLHRYILHRKREHEYDEEFIRHFVHFLLHVPEGTYNLEDLSTYPRVKALSALHFIEGKVENPEDPFITRSKIELKLNNQKSFTLLHSPLSWAFTHLQRVGFHLYSSWTKRGGIYKEWRTDELVEQMGKLFYKIGWSSYELTPDGMYLIEAIESIISQILEGRLTIKNALKKIKNPKTFVRENLYPVNPRIPQKRYSLEVINTRGSKLFGLTREVYPN